MAISRDARQLVRLTDALSEAAFVTLLAESSGDGGGDYFAPWRGAWAGHQVEVRPASAAAADEELAGYEDVTAARVADLRARLEQEELQDRLKWGPH